MNSQKTELHVIDGEKNIFDTELDYIIPLYQRAYAWEDKQLIQLIDDISDVTNDANCYYMGSLIVSRQGNKYEVVDGQQRLTSLYILLNCLGIEVKNTLTFACREKSNYTLKNICELLGEKRSKLDMDRIEQSILCGVKILNEMLNEEGLNKENFIEKLKKVVIYRIELPEHTDLNRYFEIMNTRGEQLEQHDILKARLMSYLNKDDQCVFAKIWNACSDMTGYVQMHFINTIREKLFGSCWNNMPPSDWSKYSQLYYDIMDSDSKGDSNKIARIINRKEPEEESDGNMDDGARVRFESVIDFPYFLLHTLKVFIGINNITHEYEEIPIISDLLDDKKLIKSFDEVVEHGCYCGKKISEKKALFSKDFIICLLRTRYLFDKYIIKREYANENSVGEWSLKSLYVSGQQSQKKPYYRNSKFKQGRERDNTNDFRTKLNIMIQSALRVSYTSPKVMHWITKLLLWLSEENCKHTYDANIIKYTDIAENVAKKAVKEDFLNGDKYALGVKTPHIVFNYLDYLLWKSDRKKYDNFVFEFRNSVEHWYPQHPSEGTFEPWKDGVDQFGNLCIIQRNINSKFSNMSPEAKKSTFGEMIKKGSLKLRLMSDQTESHNGDKKPASLHWKNTVCKEHGEDMIKRLKEACEVNGI